MFISKIGSNDLKFTSYKNQDEPRAQQQTKIQFEKDQELSKKADSISANPITALYYKLYRSYKFISESDSPDTVQPAKTALNVKA